MTNPKELFEANINKILLDNRMIDSSFFLCGSYIAGLLASIINSHPESWFAIDYFLKYEKTKNPQILKQGGNVCFLICGVFPERANFRSMQPGDYQKIGITLFRQFYNETGKKIGFFMSQRYPEMVEITNECIKTI